MIPTASTQSAVKTDMPRPHYDIPTAVTFLIAGLGLGSVLTLLFASRFERYSILPSEAQATH